MILKYNSFLEGKKFPNFKKIKLDDFIIYVGRDSKSNDHLTFNIADEEDLWFHVKGIPGSHVVIKVKDKLPTENIIKTAAILARDNSRAKNEENVMVVYCKRKFVKKEPGMNDGQVKVDYINSENIIV
jgi:predicted ribosome quality control (RQC) complex YloA/Tae2 family protein